MQSNWAWQDTEYNISTSVVASSHICCQNI
jgi:hypothetical protein